ncbi:hypothetical protein HZA96_05560 [Candidatus Woesearchaeota archaeon]|nr:hypothetical protein [Candidatus Woesearchaeota archaeon]
MKHKISISIEEDTVLQLKNFLRNYRYQFRSQSHIVDYALQEFLNKKEQESKHGEHHG